MEFDRRDLAHWRPHPADRVLARRRMRAMLGLAILAILVTASVAGSAGAPAEPHAAIVELPLDRQPVSP